MKITKRMKRKRWNRNKTEKALDTARETELRAQGQSLREIGRELDLDHKTVLNDLNKVDAAIQKNTQSERQKHIDRLTAEFEWARSQSKAAWDGKAGNSVTVTSKDGGFAYKITQIHKSKAHPSHVANIIKSLDSEAKLLGLYKEDAIDSAELNDSEAMIFEQLKQSRQIKQSKKPKNEA